MKPPLSIAAILLLVVGQASNQGCTVSKDITMRSELARPDKTGPIAALTKDSSTYLFDTYELRDQVLVGSGSVRKNGEERNFSGEVKLADIGYIRATDVNVLKGILAVGFVGAFVAVAGQSARTTTGLNVSPKIVYPVSGSSCPFVYAWNGNGYTLEGEAFGAGLGRALELTTCTVLPSAVAGGGQVRIRLSNERAETQYVNCVNLVAVEMSPGGTVYADGNRELWPITNETRAIAAVDEDGNDITSLIASCDGRYWESGSGTAVLPSGYRDTIELTMDIPAGISDGSFVVHAINTRLSESAYGLVAQLMGNESLAFLHATEHDPEMIQTLRAWLQEAALTVSFWKDGRWDSVGTLSPEANSVPFAKVIRWKSGPRSENLLRFRLTSLRDVWKIDAIGVDWSTATPLARHELAMKTAEAEDGRGVSERLRAIDDTYAVLLPGDRIDLVFDAWQSRPGNRLIYAADIRGYLYEWDSSDQESLASTFGRALPAGSRLTMVKALLRDRTAVLPAIYAEWGKRRAKD